MISPTRRVRWKNPGKSLRSTNNDVPLLRHKVSSRISAVRLREAESYQTDVELQTTAPDSTEIPSLSIVIKVFFDTETTVFP